MKALVAATYVAIVMVCGSSLSSGQGSNSSVPRPPNPSSPTSQSQSESYGNQSYDVRAERRLLELANQARAEAGASPLRVEEGLTKAARAHSQLMVAHQQLSHQFAGEPGLTQRLAASSDLHLDAAGENVGYAASAEQSHDGFMHSPPHRENLLNPAYNVVGIGVMRSGDMLYVTQDFGHSLPTYSGDKAENDVAEAIARTRAQGRVAPLKRVVADAVQNAACAMLKADSLAGQPLTGRHIVRYTANSPSELPNGIEKAINDPAATSFSLGVCYGRTKTYLTGTYWIVIVVN